MKPKRKNHELIFQRELCYAANLFKLFAAPIPAVRRYSAKQAMRIEDRQPFDVVLVTPTKVFGIELKYGRYSKQLDHQKHTEARMLAINPNSYYLIRKEPLRATGSFRDVYNIVSDGETLAVCKSLAEVISFFVEIGKREKAEADSLISANDRLNRENDKLMAAISKRRKERT